MKFLGQYIQNFIAKFRNEVYLEDISNPGSDTDKFLVADSDGKVGFRTGSNLQSDLGVTPGTDVVNLVTITSDSGSGARSAQSGSPDFTFQGGEGIDVTNSSGVFTVAGEDATDSNKGIASFSSDNFDVSSGAVTIKSGGVDLANEVTGFLPIANGGTGANNAGGARASLGVDAAGTDNSTNVTLAGQDYLSLSGQEITANNIDLTDDVTGTLPESNGGTGVTDVKTIVTRQVFTANFLDDLATTKHYLPLVDSPNEQTVVYRHEAAVTTPCDGRVASVTIRFENLNTHSGNANVTLGVESRIAGSSYAGTWTIEETETVAIPDTADHDTVHFHFNNDKHFDSAELFAVSIQSDVDITGTNERFWVTVVVEWDWSTYLGTKGTSAIYSSTP